MEAPDYFEPAVGWRVWLVVRERTELRLASVMYPTLWIPGREEIAVCRPAEPQAGSRLASLPHRGPHASPHERCGCGIYAAKSVAGAASYVDGAVPGGHGVTRVIGQVSLWGRVIEAERGYRASHAYPKRLYVPAGEDALAWALSVYRVPVDVLDAPSAGTVAEALAA